MKYYFLLVSIVISWACPGQSGYNFVTAPNSPSTPTLKFDDIDFYNGRFGMTCNGDGNIYKTTDSGNVWHLVHSNPSAYFRSILLRDSMNAWVGNFGIIPGGGGDPNALYRTVDGGNTWKPVNLNAPILFGICGLFDLDGIHLYGVGRIQGPAVYIKSTDGGNTWSFKDMSSYCGFLVDCYFLSADTGFAIGGSNANLNNAVPVILKTTNGGNTWNIVYSGSQLESWCWKIDFTGTTFFVSVESSVAPVICLKSTDRGNSWQMKVVSGSPYNQQAIGFLNDSIGWSGGYLGNNVYETTDGGNSWQPVINQVQNLNRIRKINDSLLWASGLQLYKIMYDTTEKLGPPPVEFNWSISHCETQKCVIVKVDDSRPNKRYSLEIFDVAGRRLYVAQAEREKVIDLKNLSFSLLYFVISDGNNSWCKSFLNY